jgi:signal transduction histidine kinase
VADLQPLARLRRTHIDLHVGERLESVIADPVQLVCALRTLVSHELHRGEGNTLRLELVREPGRGSDWMALIVEYPARELSLDQIEATLAAFERATDPHPPDGELLPLAVAQRLAKSMGGHVAVESVPGTGTALAMRVPFDFTKVKIVPSRAPPPPMITPEPSELWPPQDLS